MLAATGYALYVYPPMQSIGCGEMGIGLNQFTGSSVEVHDGAALVLPGLHEVRRFPRRDQVYRRADGVSASGAPFQAVEGLSLGVDVSVRDALDPKQIATMARNLPADLNGEVVQPVVQGSAVRNPGAIHGARDPHQQAPGDPAGHGTRNQARVSQRTASFANR
jgi:hypothetical protein